MDIALWIEQNVGAPLLGLHDKLYKATNGRIGHRIPFGKRKRQIDAMSAAG